VENGVGVGFGVGFDEVGMDGEIVGNGGVGDGAVGIAGEKRSRSEF